MKTRKLCANISTLLKKRLLMVIAGVVLCCGNIWGAKFRWDGSNHPTGNWNDSYWEKETAIAGTYSPSTEIPAAGDTVYIMGNANTEITIPSGITAACGNLYLNSDDDKTGNVILNIEGSINPSVNIFTNSGNITTGSATLNVKNDITIQNLYVKSKGADTPCSSNNTTGTIINLSTGKILTITNKIELNSQRVVKADTKLSVTGNGTVEMRMFDYAWSKENATNHTHELNIAAGSTVKVTGNLIGDSDVDGSMKFTGGGNLYIPASGAYVNWATTAIAPDYASSLNIYPIGTPTYYKVTAAGLNDFTSSAITITITRENNGGGTAAVFYPFEIKTLTNIGNGTFKIDKVYTARNAASETEFDLSPAASGFLYIPNGTTSKDIELCYTNPAVGTIQGGDGFKIEIRTPDNARVLSTIEWYFETPVWTGASSSTWSDVNNWSGLKSGSSVETSFTTDFPDYDLTINASAANMPEISSGNWSFKSITISSNASLKMTGGELSVNKLDVQGFGHFYGTDGTVKFKETGSPSVDPSLLINLKEYVTFNNLELTTGTLTVPTELTIQGNLNNKATFTAGTNNIFIGGDFEDSGTWSGTGKIIFNGTTNQTFTPESGTTYLEIEENKTAGTLTVASALSANTITLTKGSETTFNGAATITTFSDAAAAGKINFNAGGTISSDTTFVTTDDVTFSGATVLDFGTNTVTHTAGKTILKGKIKTSKLTIGNASLDGNSEIDGVLDFAGGTDAANRNSMARTAGTLKVSGDITVVSSAFYTLGSSTAVTIAPITPGSTITFTNSGDLTIPHSTKITANFINSGTLSAGGSATDSDCRINGSFTNSGSITIPAGKYFSVTGTVDDSAGTSWNGTGTLQFTGTTNQSFTNKTDRTYPSINAKLTAGNKLTVSAPLTITKFNLTSGNVDFSGSVTIGTYSETNTPAADLTFSGGGTIKSATTMGTTGTVTIPASQTLSISDGAATPTYYDFTRTAGSTTINGELIAKNITVGDVTSDGKITVKGNFIDQGTFTASTNSQIILDGTIDQEFKAGTGTYKKIEVNKNSGKTTFSTNPLKTNTIAITQSANVDFTTSVSITTLTTTATSGDINFNAGGTISSDTNFNTTGTVQFGDEVSDSITFGTNTVTLTAGNTKIAGKLTASEVSVNNLTLLSNSTITTTTADGLKLSGGADASNKNLLTGNFTLTSAGNITTSAFYEINAARVTFSPLSKTLTNNGDLYLASTTITGELSNSTNKNLTISNTTTLNGNFTNDGIFKIDSGKTFRLSKNFTNNNSVSAGSNSTFEITDNSIIGGTIFAVSNFKADNLGGKTITLNTDVTVEGTLTLKGTAPAAGSPAVAASYLTVTDDGTGYGFILSASQPATISGSAAGNYLSIGPTVKIKKADGSSDGITGRFYKASDSVPSASTSNADYATVINNGWRIKELSDLTYTWTGAAVSPASNTDWAVRSNWDIGIVPGVTPAGQAKSSGATVIIPDGKSAYPVLDTTAYTLKALTIGNSPAATPAATLTLNGSANLKISTGVATGTLTNYSQIIYSSSGRIVGNDDKPINDSTRGSVEYKTAIGTIADVTYYDLKITSGTWSNTSSKSVTVNKTLSVTGTPTITFGNGLTVKGDDISIPAGVTLKLGGTIKSISDGTPQTKHTQTYRTAVTLSANADFQGSSVIFNDTVNGGVIFKVSGNGEFSGTIGGTSAPSAVTVTGTTKINTSSINSYGNQTYTDAVTIGEQDTTFTSTTGIINFASTLTGTPTLAAGSSTPHNVIISGNADFNGDVTHFAEISVSGTTRINTTTIKTEGSQTYTGEVVLKSNATLNASVTTFNNHVSKTSSEYLKVNGNVTTTSPNTKIEPDFLLNGSLSNNNNSTFHGDFYIINGTGGISLDTTKIEGNLIIDSSDGTFPREISTSGTITASNVVLYRGKIKPASGSTIKATKDIVLLGTAYNLSNPDTGNTSEFLYQQQHGASSYNYTRTNFSTSATRPDGTALPVNSFTGEYDTNGGSVLSAGKNFYSNGTKLGLNATSEWFIDLPDIRDSANGFAESAYTEVKYSVIRSHSGSDDGSIDRMPAYYCTDNNDNRNWLFDSFEIASVKTVRDNTIQITFSRPVRNLHGELTDSSSIARLFNSSGNDYESFHTRPDCTNTNLLPASNDYSTVYLKAKNSWNTDATGTSPGTANATDRAGTHKEITPYLEIKSLTSNSPVQICDIWGKRIRNYEGSNKFDNVTDHTGPVLIKVRTGQENHTIPDGTADSQHSYDAHNFIEFRYSEPVNFGSTNPAVCDVDIPAFVSGVPNLVENIQVTDKFGALAGNITAKGELSFAGLGKIESGKLYTGANGNANKYVNALYRTDSYSIRLSIAGYTNGTVRDSTGNEFKKWTGYIESAEIPSGKVTMLSAKNRLVYDQNGNVQEKYADTPGNQNTTIPIVDSTPDGTIYGDWDLSEPIFAPLHMNVTDFNGMRTWNSSIISGKYQSEAIGNTSGVGSTLDRIEFHILDNTPDFSSANPEWVSEIGWCNYGSDGTKSSLYKPDTYSADIFGGSRPFADSSMTTGGVRYSTICNSANAFKYIDSVRNEPTLSFNNSIAAHSGGVAILFSGTSNPRRSAIDLDGLYFALSMSNTTYDIKTTFTVSYNDSKGFITDLAGNRLRSKIFTTIDRTPPSFDVSLSPLNQNEIYITFVKKLNTNTKNLIFIENDGTQKNVSSSGTFESILPACFELISIDASGNAIPSSSIKIDTTRPAKIMPDTNEDFTCIKMYLTKNVTLEDVKNLFIRLKFHPEYDRLSRDPLTNHQNSKVTFIQDMNRNFMELYTAHAFSDFAINSINPLYAYDENMSAKDLNIMNNLYGNGSWAVHDWNRNQKNYGTIPGNHDIGIVCDVSDGTGNNKNTPVNFRIYLSNNPDKDSVSNQYNSDFNRDLRIWLPAINSNIFSALAPENNANYIAFDSSLVDSKKPEKGLIFHIPASETSKWENNSQVSFLFGLMDENNKPVTIMHSPALDINHEGKYLTNTTKYPLYMLRLENPADISSIDLWSFKTRNIIEQRGGVTVLNNVINATNGEKVILKVNLPAETKLNVMVMTLDGNIIKYLNHGLTPAGEYSFSWDGKNNKGNTVARGMYFIRITADNIDETRKVIVVK